MTSAFVTFVLSMAIVLGAYVIFVILPEQRCLAPAAWTAAS